MPSLSSLRSLFPNLVGVDDQTVIGLYAKDYGLDPKAAAAELGWKPPTFAGEFKSAVPRGLGTSDGQGRQGDQGPRDLQGAFDDQRRPDTAACR